MSCGRGSSWPRPIWTQAVNVHGEQPLTKTIHRSTIQDRLQTPHYEFSDMESGFSLEGIIEAALAATLDAFGNITEAQSQ